MASFQVKWKPSALKEIKSIDPRTIPRIIQSVEKLTHNPFPYGFRKIQGGGHSFRIRAGDYRIIYQVFDSELVIEIIRVRHRKESYR
jgi:mRNA interferase RelE/StbE